MEGPIVFDGLRNGETYDARREVPGWTGVDLDDSRWNPVMVVRPPGGELRASQMPQIRRAESLTPVSVTSVGSSRVFDMGRNISGYASIQLSGLAEGQEITLKYSEKLNEEGKTDTTDTGRLIYTGDFQTDRYIAKGEGMERWTPKFTYHGFRYVELSGYPGEMHPEDLTGLFIHTDLAVRGSLQAGEDLINRIHELCLQSTRINYHSIPTDCPHCEKNGWTGDAHLSSDQVLFNFDAVTSYRKFLADIIDSQRPNGALPGIVPTPNWGYNWGSGPAWDSILPIMAWNLYLFDGDVSILETCYEPLCRYLDMLKWMEIEPGIVDFGLGDWCSPGRDPKKPKCPPIITDTGYYYADAVTASRMARVLGLTEDEKKWSGKAACIQESFIGRFVDRETGKMHSDCQTAYACALYQQLVDGDLAVKVGDRLMEQVRQADYHLDTGILGTKYLFTALSSLGEIETAYRIVMNPTFPGWAYELANGATTLWEYWDGKRSQMHHMYSDIDAWFYRYLAGISPDPEKPGFRNILFRPACLRELGSMKGTHETPYGTARIEWEIRGNEIVIGLLIPPSCTGTLTVPGNIRLKESGAQSLRLNAGIHTVRGVVI